MWALPDSENHKALTQFSQQQIPHLCLGLIFQEAKLSEVAASTDSLQGFRLLIRAKSARHRPVSEVRSHHHRSDVKLICFALFFVSY